MLNIFKQGLKDVYLTTVERKNNKMRVEITYKDIILLIEGDYYPPEDGEMYDSNMTGLPDSPATFEIQDVFLVDCENSIYSLVEDNLEDLEELVLNKML